MADDVKTAEELIAMGGVFYEIDGVSWCDTPVDSWKFVPGVGYVLADG